MVLRELDISAAAGDNMREDKNRTRLRCGLVGRSLGHSFSPEIHAKIAGLSGIDYEYSIFERQPEELEDFIREGDWIGLNVTIPYKEDVMRFCDEIAQEAREIGAVNTLIKKNGKIFGYNTDYFGFKRSLEETGVKVDGKIAAVLGSGGASKAVQKVLRDMGAARIDVVSRKGELNYENLKERRDAEILVNTTPVGMYPNTGISAVFPASFPMLEWAVDVIYNPLRTNFLCQAKKAGINTLSGMKMLVWQAVSAAELFFEAKIDGKVAKSIESELIFDKQNFVFIGMPGAGKTTIGSIVASELGREFYDVDEMIVAMEGKSIPEIFAEGGEEAFRRCETEVIAELSKVTGAVIACGGGVVTREENYYLLAENGRIIFLERDISQLSAEGRPISLAVPAEVLYNRRLPLYVGWADDMVMTGGRGPEEMASHIISMIR